MTIKDKKKLLIRLLKEEKITEEEFLFLIEEKTEHLNKKNNKIKQNSDGFYEV